MDLITLSHAHMENLEIQFNHVTSLEIEENGEKSNCAEHFLMNAEALFL